MRKDTGLRSPRIAVQHTEWHRHFRADGYGTTEHSHAIGRRVHEHMEQRLSRVLLSWADRGPASTTTYEEDPMWLELAAVVFIMFVFALFVILA